MKHGLDVDLSLLQALIQSEGYLIALSFCGRNELRIAAISENFSSIIASEFKNMAELLDVEIGHIFDSNEAVILRDIVNKLMSTRQADNFSSSYNIIGNLSSLKTCHMMTKIVLGTQLYSCSVSVSSHPNIFILEFERANIPCSKAVGYNDVILPDSFVEKVGSENCSENLPILCCNACMEMLPDFEHGIVFCFEDDLTGRVIYEQFRDSENKHQISYTGNNIPSIDISLDLRNQFMKGESRFVYDVNGTPNTLYSKTSGMQIDLSFSRLGHPSQQHMDYLRSIGVKSSLSLPIVVGEKLWGMCVFRSYGKTVRMSFDDRVVVETCASIAAIRLEALKRESVSNLKSNLSLLNFRMQAYTMTEEFLGDFQTDLCNIFKGDCMMFWGTDNSYHSKHVFGNQAIQLTEEGFNQLANSCNSDSSLVMNSFSEGLGQGGESVIFFKRETFSLAVIRATTHLPTTSISNNTGCEYPNANNNCIGSSIRTQLQSWSSDDQDLLRHFCEQLVYHRLTLMVITLTSSLMQANKEIAQVTLTAKEHSDFFAQMSHELRTPFHGVLSALQV